MASSIRRRLPLRSTRVSSKGNGRNDGENPYAKKYEKKNGLPQKTATGLQLTPCASGKKCGMPTAPLTTVRHLCQHCGKKVHGALCCVPQTDKEEGQIYYCLMCGRDGKGCPQENSSQEKPSQENSSQEKPSQQKPSQKKPPQKKPPQKKPPQKKPPQKKKTKGKATAKIATKTNRRYRRPVHSRPPSLSAVKDRTVRNKFAVCAKHLSELQFCNTFEESEDRKQHPKSQHFMFSYDELVEVPHNAENSRYRRKKPQSFFLAPEGVDEKELGKSLIEVGKEMVSKNSRKGYYLTTDKEKYFSLVFGKQGKN